MESSRETFGDDLAGGMRKIAAAHEGQEMQGIMFQFTSREQNGFTVDMMDSMNEAFCELKDSAEIKWGMAVNPDDMKAEFGIYIIVNFK